MLGLDLVEQGRHQFRWWTRAGGYTSVAVGTGLLFPFPMRREDYTESDLLEFEGREGLLPE